MTLFLLYITSIYSTEYYNNSINKASKLSKTNSSTIEYYMSRLTKILIRL